MVGGLEGPEDSTADPERGHACVMGDVWEAYRAPGDTGANGLGLDLCR